MKQIIKTFEIPTDIYILGTIVNDKATLSITDDYSTCYVASQDSSFLLDTDGFVTILTKEEFEQLKNGIDIDLVSSCEYVFLEKYQGDIFLHVTNEDGKIDKEFDLKEYIQHQTEVDGWCDIEIQVNMTIEKTESIEELLEN